MSFCGLHSLGSLSVSTLLARPDSEDAMLVFLIVPIFVQY